ncbi:MAG: penicillin-binding transpeptidase domain-containing protein, partial [Myxococcales bacterium]
LDTPFDTPAGAWQPRNYDRRQHGPVRLRAALANSYNVPAVRLAEQLGPERILRLLRRAGFGSLDGDAAHYGVGLVLGNGEVTLRELARAYRGLALGGVLHPVHELVEAKDASGRTLPLSRELRPRRFLPSASAALLTDILSDEAARIPAFGHDNALRLPFPVAAKTGTSRAHIDNWTVGYTRERTVAVWVGNFDGRPMLDVSGITGAAPIFRRVMLAAMRGLTPAPLVDTRQFQPLRICPLSGARASAHCPQALTERFVPGTGPGHACDMHRPDGVDFGPEFHAWARAEGLDPRPPMGGPGPLRVVSPRDGDEFLLDPSLPVDAQRIPLQVLAPADGDTLLVRVDDGDELPLAHPWRLQLPASRGAHRLEVRSRSGRAPAAQVAFTVR